ncbi:MAG: hypothetical protein L3J65_03290 [Robiginitomaculum sp.]|nr:hypothetical protein [Robiginitomaculum sp.]
MAAWWKVLEVEADADLRAVKRAYAAKLKTIRQDEDPKGFMELRAAYDAARAHISYHEQQANDVTNEITNESVIEVDPDWEVLAQDAADTPPEISYPTIVEQLMDEVHTLINSPWGAGNVGSWTAILDDERLDDIDVYSDFENALLNYMLNIHGFFDEDANVKPKLDLTIAHLVFERFGWQNNRNSVHFNPVVYDWLADKFFRQHEDATYGDLKKIDLRADPAHANYSQFNQRRLIKKPSPRMDKFLKWFDGNGAFILVCLMIALMAIYYAFSPAANKSWDTIYRESIIASQTENNAPDYFGTQKKINLGNSIENIADLDCSQLEAWAKNYTMAESFGERPLDVPSTNEAFLPATDPMEVFKNMEVMKFEDRPANALDEALEKIWQDIESGKTGEVEASIDPAGDTLEERFKPSIKSPTTNKSSIQPWLRAKCLAEERPKYDLTPEE